MSNDAPEGYGLSSIAAAADAAMRGASDAEIRRILYRGNPPPEPPLITISRDPASGADFDALRFLLGFPAASPSAISLPDPARVAVLDAQGAVIAGFDADGAPV